MGLCGAQWVSVGLSGSLWDAVGLSVAVGRCGAQEAVVRLRCVGALRALYAVGDTAAQMELFTNRFRVSSAP